MCEIKDGWTNEDIERLIRTADDLTVGRAVIYVAMDPPNRIWAERLCIRMAAHPSAYVRGNAILGFGHLARIFRYLNQSSVKGIIESGLSDPDSQVRSKAGDAADDIEWYLGWVLRGREGHRTRPVCPR